MFNFARTIRGLTNFGLFKDKPYLFLGQVIKRQIRIMYTFKICLKFVAMIYNFLKELVTDY